MNLIQRTHFFLSFGIFISLLFSSVSLAAQDGKFIVVIDAGHGGHDAGAVGAISKEKDINLSVSLKLGEIIDQKFKDVKVVFTRKTDRYLTLQERADVVNNNHADLFICVHTNASPSASAFGAETFTLGLAKSKSNLDVAMRENSVITLEDNYKSKYQGFDPNSVDSYIMFEFMQDKYIDRSVAFASSVQKQFSSYCNRSDRGVRQAGFWVLHRSACPSVLVELGFISNPAEERYLSSDIGQTEMSGAIFNAFVDYKKDHDRKSGKQSGSVAKFEPTIIKAVSTDSDVETSSNMKELPKADSIRKVGSKLNEKASVESKTIISTATDNKLSVSNSKVANVSEKGTSDTKISPNTPIFKVQILASPKKLMSNAFDFKGVKGVGSFFEGNVYKYTVGSETNYSRIEKIRSELLSKFPNAFIIAFVDGKKVPVNQALMITR